MGCRAPQTGSKNLAFTGSQKIIDGVQILKFLQIFFLVSVAVRPLWVCHWKQETTHSDQNRVEIDAIIPLRWSIICRYYLLHLPPKCANCAWNRRGSRIGMRGVEGPSTPETNWIRPNYQTNLVWIHPQNHVSSSWTNWWMNWKTGVNTPTGNSALVQFWMNSWIRPINSSGNLSPVWIGLYFPVRAQLHSLQFWHRYSSQERLSVPRAPRNLNTHVLIGDSYPVPCCTSSRNLVQLHRPPPPKKALLLQPLCRDHCNDPSLLHSVYAMRHSTRAACHFHTDLSELMSETCFGYNHTQGLSTVS